MFTNCKSRLQQNSNFDFPIVSFTYSPLYNLTSPISRVLIGEHLIFCSQRHQRAVTRVKNVRQLNIRRGKKLGFQLLHRQPL